MWVSAFIFTLFIFLKGAFKIAQSLDPIKHQGFTLMAGKKGWIWDLKELTRLGDGWRPLAFRMICVYKGPEAGQGTMNGLLSSIHYHLFKNGFIIVVCAWQRVPLYATFSLSSFSTGSGHQAQLGLEETPSSLIHGCITAKHPLLSLYIVLF